MTITALRNQNRCKETGRNENRCDGLCILDIICWFSKWMNTQTFEPGNGLCELNGHYKWKSCTGTVPRSIQYPGGDSEVSGSPCIGSQEEITGSVDRIRQNDDNANWSNENPNRAGGRYSRDRD